MARQTLMKEMFGAQVRMSVGGTEQDTYEVMGSDGQPLCPPFNKLAAAQNLAKIVMLLSALLVSVLSGLTSQEGLDAALACLDGVKNALGKVIDTAKATATFTPPPAPAQPPAAASDPAAAAIGTGETGVVATSPVAQQVVQQAAVDTSQAAQAQPAVAQPVVAQPVVEQPPAPPAEVAPVVQPVVTQEPVVAEPAAPVTTVAETAPAPVVTAPAAPAPAPESTDSLI